MKEQLIGQLKKYGIIIVLIMVGCGYWLLSEPRSPFEDDEVKIVKVFDNEVPSEKMTDNEKKPSPDEEKAGVILVHVAGEVEKPGVYELEASQRIIHAIEKATAKPSADINSLNLASHLTDGQKIVVPKKGEKPIAVATVSSEGGNAGFKSVSINHASKEELKSLPSIGDKRAEDIIAYREAHGGFKTIEELKEVSGIGEKTFEKLKDKISL